MTPPDEESAVTRSNKAPRTSSWRLSNWRLRTKLLVVVLVPSLAAAIFGGLRVADDFARVNRLSLSAEEVHLQAPASGLTQALQRERDLTVAHVASNRSNPQAMQSQRKRVDDQIRKFRGAVEGSSAKVGDPYREAIRNLDVLTPLRASVDTTAYPSEDVRRAYTDTIGGVTSLVQKGLSGMHDPELLRSALATNALVNAQEAASLKRAQLGVVANTGEFGPGQVRELLGVEAKLEAAVSDFRTWATPEQAQLYNDTVTGLQVDNARHLEEFALSMDSANRPVVINPRDWDAASTETVNLIGKVHENLSADMEQRHQAVDAAAYRGMLIASIATVLMLIITFVIALLVARSLLLPLRTLRRSALRVAEYRLPEAVQSILEESTPDLAAHNRIEPIPVHTTEEIGRVARSFDAVHSQALRLASEQAFLRNNVNDLFVNLARRSQSLVQRQLALIDRLEQDEQDPDQLSQLFELDHMATRMRRNNENLLILGGADLTRRMMRPVPLNEVLGAAVSEVEQYARISVSDAPELAIQGRVVNDLVHLVAELLENATVYSNPDTEVAVRTAYRKQELVLEIRDRGVGIDPQDLESINERLLRPPEVDVAISRRMGLYVVGQLSRRHNLRVELENNGGLEGGVTATVHIAGEYVSQLTENGPVPMVEARPAAEDRDAMSETGSHLGLAAAFGGNDLVGSDRSQFVNGAPQQDLAPGAAEVPQESTGESTEFTPQSTWEGDSGELPRVTDSAADEADEDRTGDPNGHDPLSAAALSNWSLSGQDNVGQDTGGQDVVGQDANAWDTGGTDSGSLWPSENDADSTSGDLFTNPFEASKTQRISVPEPSESEATASAEDFRFGADTAEHSSGSHALVTDEPSTQDAGGTDAETEFTDLSQVQAPAQPAAPTPPVRLGATSPTAGRSPDDAPTERLPIYEAVLSQWFMAADSKPSASEQGGAEPVDEQRSPDHDTELLDPSAVSSAPAENAESFESAQFDSSHLDRSQFDHSTGEQGGPSPLDQPQFDQWQPSQPLDHSEPELAQADAPQPEMAQPEMAQSEMAQPEMAQPDIAQPDLPQPEQPEPPRAEPETVNGLPKRTPRSSRERGPAAPAQAPEGAANGEATTALPIKDLPSSTSTGEQSQVDSTSTGGRRRAEPGWGSADAGWEAAEALVEQSKNTPETTAAGLPKRVPKTNLVPGSAAARPSSAPKKPAPTRSADAVRGRMSNFQRGIRRGRHAKAEPVSTEQSRSNPSRPEEQE